MSGKRITFKQRVIIQCLLENEAIKSLSVIATKTKLPRVTIYREIKNRLLCKGSKQYKFLREKPNPCDLLKQFPFCCNRCYKLGSCPKEIYIYDAYNAQEKYEYKKFNCNKGPRITKDELKIIDERVSPRIMLKQSIYHVVSSDEHIKVCEQTIRRYINAGYLKAKPIDLPKTVQRRPSKDLVNEKRGRVDVKLINGRMYEDYLLFIKQYPNTIFLQIDTVIGKRKDKKFILTLYETTTKLQFGILLYRTTTAVNNAILDLIKNLKRVNCKFFDGILTDNGFEFEMLPQIESDEFGEIQFKLFYCDPYASYQKGACERNHELFRYIKRKGISLDSLTQFDVDEIFSNINALKRKSLNGLSPYDSFKQKFGALTLEVLNIHYVEPLNVILKY